MYIVITALLQFKKKKKRINWDKENTNKWTIKPIAIDLSMFLLGINNNTA